MYKILSSAEIVANIENQCDKMNLSPADVLKILGMGRNTLRNIKERETFPRVDTLARFANFFGCGIDDIVRDYTAL